MPAFQHVFGEKDPTSREGYIIASMWLSLWAVGFPVGTMLGAAAGGWIQDKTGRRWTLCIGSLISIAAIAICYVSDITANKQATLLGGKLVEGVAVGVTLCSTQTYRTRHVPTSYASKNKANDFR